MTTIDFRNGGWGHYLHVATWTESMTQTGWFRWTRQATVLVHCAGVWAGDRILYRANGGDRLADVVGVERLPGTDDMYQLTLENIREAP